MSTLRTASILLTGSFVLLLAFQNCAEHTFDGSTLKPIPSTTSGGDGGGDVGQAQAHTEIINPDLPPVPYPLPPTYVPPVSVCLGISCDLTPLTEKPSVTTVLIALGDEANNQLVVDGASAQLIAESVIRYSSPVSNPKILFAVDSNTGGESPEDTTYVAHQLLSRYNVNIVTISADGLTDAELEGYDVIWFNNPGYPMSSVNTRDALLRFKGAVILQGDDLSRGDGFELTDLTGLTYVDNGTSFKCGDKTYSSDNNSGTQYAVALDGAQFTGASSANLTFVYGNDIDNTVVARPDLQVLASAKGNVSECTDKRPAIVRYQKN
jgi:hypothetical protein